MAQTSQPPFRNTAALRTLLLALALASPGATSRAQDSVRTAAGLAGDARHADGPAAVARFADPVGIAVAADGRVYIADAANHCIRLRTPDGRVATVAGQPGEPGMRDGTGGVARLDSPSGITLGWEGSLLVADTGNHAVRRLMPDGRLVTLAGMAGEPGVTNGPATTARFDGPLGIVATPDHAIFVADSGNHSIRRIAPDLAVTTYAGENGDWGARDGPAGTARFNGPVGLALASDGSLWVADSLNHAIRRIAPDGIVTTAAGKLGEDGSSDGPAADARFGKPAELAFDPRGRLYIVDAFLHALRRLDPDGRVRTVAGIAGQPGDADGNNRAGRFLNPYGIGVLPGGSLMVTDTFNATLREVIAPFALSAGKAAGASAARVEWESVAGRRYQVFAAGELGQPWQPVGSPITATATTMVFEDSRPGTRLYQIQRLEE